jgi:hypothetical protein
MITIQKRRQGVANFQRAWFLPCPHGEHWHWEWMNFQQSQTDGVCSISYPNCYECYPGRDGHAGQTAWSIGSRWNPHKKCYCRSKASQLKANLATLPEAEKQTIVVIKRLTGRDVQFSTDVEVYCFNDDWTMKHFPHTANDIYVASAVYEQPTDTIRHVPSNVCLITFQGDRAPFDTDAAAAPYRAECEKAFHEFLLDHNQRKSDRENKGWLAWLLSEYIKDAHPDEKPVKLRTICVDGNWLFSKAIA